MHLYEALAHKVTDWRKQRYSHDNFPTIAEILDWTRYPDVSSFRLRTPQLRALETYWYLRLVEGTPHIFDLYQRYYTKTTKLLSTLGLDTPQIHHLVMDEG